MNSSMTLTPRGITGGPRSVDIGTNMQTFSRMFFPTLPERQPPARRCLAGAWFAGNVHFCTVLLYQARTRKAYKLRTVLSDDRPFRPPPPPR